MLVALGESYERLDKIPVRKLSGGVGDVTSKIEGGPNVLSDVKKAK